MYRKYIFFFVLCFSSLSWGGSYIVMSSADASLKENIDITDLKDIFLGNRLFWRNGERIFAVHVKKDSSPMITFLKSVLAMSPRKYNTYWRRRLFSGKGHPPLEIISDKKTIDYVKKTQGAIGIIANVPKRKPRDLFFFKASKDGHELENIK